VRASKIQLRGQFRIDRRMDEPVYVQLVRQVESAVQRGTIAPGAMLPSSRALAGALDVSRNTVLAAYDELTARGLIRGHRGAGMRVTAAAGVRRFSVRRVLRDAQYPARKDRRARPGRESDRDRVLVRARRGRQ
jgi:GntR family transcriptional regulator/MocR family aminotransferase